MTPFLLDSVPQERIVAIAVQTGGTRGQRGQELRRRVAESVEGKKHRMTPWGIQFLRGGGTNDDWIPALPNRRQHTICGRWIRDLEVPDFEYFSCTKMVLSDQFGIGTEVLTAFQHGETTDPSLDLAHRYESVVATKPETKRCMITKLPQELFDIILDYLVPEGQTYHFLPVRSDGRIVQIVQKFVPESTSQKTTSSDAITATRASGPNTIVNPMDALPNISSTLPATGSAHLSLAGTCTQLQQAVYKRFYGANAFIFNFTANAIHSFVHIRDTNMLRSWSRIVPQKPQALGTLTERTASYLKDVTIIASLPHSHGSQDINALTDIVLGAASDLAPARLNRLAAHFEIAAPAQDNRYSLVALPIDILQAGVSLAGKLKVQIREPTVHQVRDSNRAQRAMIPLLSGPKGVRNIELSGFLSESLVSDLESALKEQTSCDLPGSQQENITRSSGVQAKKRRLR